MKNRDEFGKLLAGLILRSVGFEQANMKKVFYSLALQWRRSVWRNEDLQARGLSEWHVPAARHKSKHGMFVPLHSMKKYAAGRA
jgi:hypothetical protein